MKKVLLAVVVLAVTIGSGFAQTAGSIGAGVKAGGVLGFHDFDIGPGDSKSRFNVTVGGFGSYTIIDRLSVQLELDFMIAQGDDYSKYNSLDIPLLIKFAFLQEPLRVGVAAGPQISIPIGDIEFDITGYQKIDGEADGFAFGAVAGLYAGFPLGSGLLLGDIRFYYDFNAQQGKSEYNPEVEGFINRRGLIFTLGYEFSF
jgi:hypothetical protein